jgi:hypothetical protein
VLPLQHHQLVAPALVLALQHHQQQAHCSASAVLPRAAKHAVQVAPARVLLLLPQNQQAHMQQQMGRKWGCSPHTQEQSCRQNTLVRCAWSPSSRTAMMGLHVCLLPRVQQQVAAVNKAAARTVLLRRP